MRGQCHEHVKYAEGHRPRDVQIRGSILLAVPAAPQAQLAPARLRVPGLGSDHVSKASRGYISISLKPSEVLLGQGLL